MQRQTSIPLNMIADTHIVSDEAVVDMDLIDYGSLAVDLSLLHPHHHHHATVKPLTLLDPPTLASPSIIHSNMEEAELQWQQTPLVRRHSEQFCKRQATDTPCV